MFPAASTNNINSGTHSDKTKLKEDLTNRLSMVISFSGWLLITD